MSFGYKLKNITLPMHVESNTNIKKSGGNRSK